jgi:alpha-N-acetylglucosaminidase
MADPHDTKTTRRDFLGLTASGFVSLALPQIVCQVATASEKSVRPGAKSVLQRLLGAHASQIHLTQTAGPSESFRITGSAGAIHVEGSTQSALLMGVNWYLKYVAGASISWNGDSLAMLPAILPAPAKPIVQQANAEHRFALNDCNDGYTGPYWTWQQWERLIDVLALHGINEVLVYMGAEAVYQQTLLHFGYTTEELQRWFPTPAHQPWWLLENLSGWVGPSVSQQLIDRRLKLAAQITQRLRELDMRAVLPGYYGIVPDGFAQRNPGAHIVPQGDWLPGMKRPDWLDPTCAAYAEVAKRYYQVQEDLLGPATIFKMDPLHEGGKAGGVDLAQAARSIHTALRKAHPTATWALLGWQDNPKPALLAGIEDKSSLLIYDGLSDRYAYQSREEEWAHTPYAFGTIWNFGGHTRIGANLGVWNERYFQQLSAADSKLSGIAMMPEASCNNPAAFAFFTELPWCSEGPDLVQWFDDYARYRYGGDDAHTRTAWSVLRQTAYSGNSDGESEPHGNLFANTPGLDQPGPPRYDLAVFRGAIGALLQARPELRASSAYRYDLVDVARQTLSNHSRELLPGIAAAYSAGDAALLRKLCDQWLEVMSSLERLVSAEPAFLLGPWLAAAKSSAANPAERLQLEFDARSILMEWGPDSAKGSGLLDYASREWDGLLAFYRKRWALFFSMLEESLEQHESFKSIDWYAMAVAWSKQTETYDVRPQGDAYELAKEAISAMTGVLINAGNGTPI